MNADRTRTVEVRLIVIAWVNLADDHLADVLAASDPTPSSIAGVVSAEVVSNLESVSYIEHAIASQL
jgi:hypothetical protein